MTAGGSGCLGRGLNLAPSIMADGAARRPDDTTIPRTRVMRGQPAPPFQAGTPGMSITRTPIASQRLRRRRRTKIIATLGPASSTTEVITRLFQTGADVFRLNFSHGSHEDHAARVASIREVEKRFDRPIGILADVQGPKLRVGRFAGGQGSSANGSALPARPQPDAGRQHPRQPAASRDHRGGRHQHQPAAR